MEAVSNLEIKSALRATRGDAQRAAALLRRATMASAPVLPRVPVIPEGARHTMTKEENYEEFKRMVNKRANRRKRQLKAEEYRRQIREMEEQAEKQRRRAEEAAAKAAREAEAQRLFENYQEIYGLHDY